MGARCIESVRKPFDFVQEARLVDPLSDVLSGLRVKDSGFGCTYASAPWGIALRENKRRIRFHYVKCGTAWLATDGASCGLALTKGDVVVLVHGHAHTVKDDPASGASDLADLVHANRREEKRAGAFRGPFRVRVGSEGVTATVASGSFEYEYLPEIPILSALPRVLRITTGPGRDIPSFEESLRGMAREIEANRPGSQMVLTRMVDILVVHMLRAYLDQEPQGAAGFLGALRDPCVSAALALIHRRPEEPWTVGSLASRVGLSRSSFAAKFTELVGAPPLGYLTRVRMQRAIVLLREGATLARAARLTGYSSEASFSYAFRQWAGVAPGAYRARLRRGPTVAE